jgi:hypothetical protein
MQSDNGRVCGWVQQRQQNRESSQRRRLRPTKKDAGDAVAIDYPSLDNAPSTSGSNASAASPGPSTNAVHIVLPGLDGRIGMHIPNQAHTRCVTQCHARGEHPGFDVSRDVSRKFEYLALPFLGRPHAIQCRRCPGSSPGDVARIVSCLMHCC